MKKKSLKKQFQILLVLTILALVFAFGCGRKKPADAAGETVTATEETSDTTVNKDDSDVINAEKTETGPDAKAEAETEDTFQTDTDDPDTSTVETEAGDTTVSDPEPTDDTTDDQIADIPVIDENGTYTSRDEVALYIHTYNKLPSNFMTKKEAKKLGWEGGSLEPFAPGKCIGGDFFGNYEELLPEKKGREYRECDIDTLGKKKRGAKRIIYSNDGLIYYTEDHYESFELLYGEE